MLIIWNLSWSNTDLWKLSTHKLLYGQKILMLTVLTAIIPVTLHSIKIKKKHSSPLSQLILLSFVPYLSYMKNCFIKLNAISNDF